MKYFVTSIIFLCGSCSSKTVFFDSIRDKYYQKALRQVIADSLASQNMISTGYEFKDNDGFVLEKGTLFIQRDASGEVGFYETGEWTTYDYQHRVAEKALFDKTVGLVQSEGWAYQADKQYLLDKKARFICNDSIIQRETWFYPNGQPRVTCTYFIEKHYRKKHWERLHKIGLWQYFTPEGDVAKSTLPS